MSFHDQLRYYTTASLLPKRLVSLTAQCTTTQNTSNSLITEAWHLEKNMQSENTTKCRIIASEINENCFYGALKSDADALTQLEHGIYMIL